MNCDVIKDLIPLYIDGCCSEESTSAVKEHLAHCQACSALAEEMSAEMELSAPPAAPNTMGPLNQWKASILQSVLLFVSFAFITIGVALEAASPSGLLNSFWAFNLVVPATGFMLSLANWYFIRLYKSKKQFSICSMLVTMGIILCCYAWTGIHYEVNTLMWFIAPINYNGIFLSVVFCVLSKTLSGLYAKLIGKE